MDSAFRRRVIEQLGAALKPRDRAGAGGARPALKVRQSGLGHVEIAVDVGLQGFVEALFGDVFKRMGMLLEGGVVDQYVELAEFLHGFF